MNWTKSVGVTLAVVLIGAGPIMGANTATVDSTGLIEAAQSGDLAAVKKQLAANVDVNTKDKEGVTALAYAVYGGHTAVVSLLLANGADEGYFKKDFPPIVWLSAAGLLDRVKVDIEKGADMNARDTDGRTALTWAASKGHAEVVSLLLSKGADVHCNEDGSGSPLQSALSRGHTNVVDMLLAKGANINTETRTSAIGWTPLMLAAMGKGNPAEVRMLLAKGADVNHRSSIGPVGVGLTALMIASSSGNSEIASLLIDKGAKIDEQTEVRRFQATDNGEVLVTGGDTALIYASQNGAEDVVRLLLAKGARFDLKNGKQETALSVGKNEVVRRLLREAGAKE